MSHEYDEKFIDDEALVEASTDSDFNDEFYNSDEINADPKKMQRLCKVEVRRRVEEIMADRDYKRRYSDPFNDFEE